MAKKIDIKSIKKIAVLQTAFLGDIALSLPLFQELKRLTNSSLCLITTPLGAEIGSVSPFIDEIIVYDKRGKHKGLKGIKDLSKLIKSKGFELGISLHRSFRSSLLFYLTDIPFTIGYNTSSLSFLYRKKNKYFSNLHEIQRNLSFIKHFFDDYDLHYPKPKVELPELKVKLPESFIVIAPGSVWKTKRWLPSHFNELVKLFEKDGKNIILLGGKADSHICKKVRAGTNAIDLSGSFSIPESISIMSKAELIITNDSAPTHFAYLSNTPTLTIYGPTSPIFGFAPVGKYDRVVSKYLECSPCEIHGSNKCPIGTHECMTSITPEEVFLNANEILEETNSQTSS